MSRLTKKPIILSERIAVKEEDGVFYVKGTRGEMKINILPFLKIETTDEGVKISPISTIKQSKANSGTMWALIRNAIEGVTNGFSKVLEIEGIGFRASMDGKTLVLNLGFVNPIRFDCPEGISITVEKNTIKIEGFDKALVGKTASEIRALKKPEPYKGKGIHYQGEIIKRKAGKKAATTAA